MFRTGYRISIIAMALGASLAVAPVAEAAGYAGNGCVSKKQVGLSKYTKSVGKAWSKYPADAVARDAAIAAALTKLEGAWDKSEAKALKKNASCEESTSTAAAAATVINDAAAAVSGDPTPAALTSYVSAAIKTYGKYIKDPVKDPGKAKLTDKLAGASAKHLAGTSVLITDTAATLQADLIALTTTAPDYPTTFQTIEPNVCAAGTCGGTNQVCATNADCNTHIYKKKALQPQCVDKDPYMYFAKKGTSNNVLMYYQGGGACWSDTSCFTVGTCDRTAVASDNPALATTGFADYNNPANPFADWNIVFVSYCSCDVHWGEGVYDYPGAGNIAYHYGRVNAALVEKFAREHFLDPDRVFVTGSSAGSYGAIMNSYYLLKEVWPNADTAVLGDAGVGVITQGFLDDYIDNWGITANFPTDLPGVELPVTDLSLVDLVDGLAQKYPNARFANYDSSYDGGSGSQCQFFQVMRNPPPANFLTEWGSWWEAACEWNACMRAFKEENSTRASNYKYFTGAGTRHTMFGSDKVYTEAKSTDADGNGVTIADWVNAMIDDTPAWVDVDCNNLNGDCSLTNSCQGGDNPGIICSTNTDCAVGGTCQHDPDSANAPLNNDDTVNCALTECPCGVENGKCVYGSNVGGVCDDDADCPGGSCVWVRCPTFTP
ncbi:MAG: pectin acetylesterase-family hydrolase [Candidatus Binatia bacterium]